MEAKALLGCIWFVSWFEGATEKPRGFLKEGSSKGAAGAALYQMSLRRLLNMADDRAWRRMTDEVIRHLSLQAAPAAMSFVIGHL